MYVHYHPLPTRTVVESFSTAYVRSFARPTHNYARPARHLERLACLNLQQSPESA